MSHNDVTAHDMTFSMSVWKPERSEACPELGKKRKRGIGRECREAREERCGDAEFQGPAHDVTGFAFTPDMLAVVEAFCLLSRMPDDMEERVENDRKG